MRSDLGNLFKALGRLEDAKVTPSMWVWGDVGLGGPFIVVLNVGLWRCWLLVVNFA